MHRTNRIHAVNTAKRHLKCDWDMPLRPRLQGDPYFSVRLSRRVEGGAYTVIGTVRKT